MHLTPCLLLSSHIFVVSVCWLVLDHIHKHTHTHHMHADIQKRVHITQLKEIDGFYVPRARESLSVFFFFFWKRHDKCSQLVFFSFFLSFTVHLHGPRL